MEVIRIQTVNPKINDILAKWEVEIRRGVIVLLVLGGLVDEDLHGKALVESIAQRTRQVIEVPLGTIYPLLSRFIRDGLIETYKDKEDKRLTYYKLNRAGRQFFYLARELWVRYTAAVNDFIDRIDEAKLGGLF